MSEDKEALRDLELENKKEIIKQLIGLLEQIEDSLDKACSLYPKNKAMTFNIIGSETQAIEDYLKTLKSDISDTEIRELLEKIINKESSEDSNIYS